MCYICIPPNTLKNNSQMVMHTSTENSDISLAKASEKLILDPSCAHGLINHGKERKRASKRKLT